MIIKEHPIKDSLQTDSLVIRSEKAFNLVENAASEIKLPIVVCIAEIVNNVKTMKRQKSLALKKKLNKI